MSKVTLGVQLACILSAVRQGTVDFLTILELLGIDSTCRIINVLDKSH